MEVAVYRPERMPLSFRVNLENWARCLSAGGVAIRYFDGAREGVPKADVYWDPRAGGGHAPAPIFEDHHRPLVVTLHGAAAMALSLRQQAGSLRGWYRILRENAAKRRAWRASIGRCFRIVTVSRYAKSEIERYLPIPADKLIAVYSGVDHALFNPGPGAESPPYLLHVSQYDPKKNFDRVLRAFLRLPDAVRPRLKAVVPGYRGPTDVSGVEFQTTPLPQRELVPLYRGALGFVFPSFHETFGNPIIEAMACGCPVITSNRAACPETAGDAALIVDPDSEDAIGEAMRRLATEPELRAAMRAQGLARASTFSWEASSARYLKVFRQAVAAV
jgi:glycosyltransferase involved in cell wall biosynthesis